MTHRHEVLDDDLASLECWLGWRRGHGRRSRPAHHTSGTGGVVSQDIPDRCRETSRTASARWVVGGFDVGGCQRLVWSSLLSSSRVARSPRWRRPTGWPVRGSTTSSPASGSRATRRSSRGRGGRHSSPRATPSATVELIVELRDDSSSHGLDAGADTICWHLAQRHQLRVSPATVVSDPAPPRADKAEPRKRPRSSYIRFEAEQPNEMLAGRFHPLAARRRLRRRDPVLARRPLPHADLGHRPPSGDRRRRRRHVHERPGSTRYPGVDVDRQRMVFTTRLSGGRGGRNGFETSSTASASARRTAGRTIRRPAAKSNASNRP